MPKRWVSDSEDALKTSPLAVLMIMTVSTYSSINCMRAG